MKRFCFIMIVVLLFVSFDNLNIAKGNKNMQKLIWVNANGDSVDLTSGNYGITEWNGFSGTELNIQSQQVPFHDGSVYLDGLLSERELSVTLAMDAKNDLEKRYRLRRELIEILNPKMGEGYLIYHNDFTSKRIKCVPQIPLFENCNSNDSGTPKASLAWTACDPYWEDLEDTEITFNSNLVQSIKNEGDIPSQVKINVNTDNVENPTIVNLTTNQKIKYNGTLDSILGINTNFGEKEVYTEESSLNINQNHLAIKGFCFDYNSSSYIAIKDNCIMRSYDTKTWDIILQDFDKIFTTCFYSRNVNKLIVSRNDGVFLISSDGETFIEQVSGVSVSMNRFIETSSLVIGVGDNGTIITSADLTTWSIKTSGTTANLKSICYSSYQSKYIIVGKNQGNYSTGSVTLISSDLESWTENTFSAYFYDICYSREKDTFVIAAGAGIIMESGDGTTWVYHSGLGGDDYVSVKYISWLHVFVALTGDSRTIYSDTSNTWVSGSRVITVPNASMSGGLFDFELDEKFYAFGVDGYLGVCDKIPEYNSDWEVLIEPVYGSLCDGAYSDKSKIFIAVGSNSNGYMNVAKTNNGINWIYDRISTVTTRYVKRIRYIKEKDLFIICAGDALITSDDDGDNWIIHTTSFTNVEDIIYDSKRNCYYAVGYISSGTSNWASLQKMSSDFSSYNELVQLTNYHFYSICFSKEKKTYIAGASGGKIIVGLDNSTEVDWQSDIYPTIPMSGTVYQSLYSEQNKKFILAYGSDILYSIDGKYYNRCYVSDELGTVVIDGVAFNEGEKCLVATGRINNTYGNFLYGCVFISYNGINWERKHITKTAVYKSAYMGNTNKFFITGEQGSIFQLETIRGENVIQNISSDSDMSFNLQKGNNNLKVSQTNGSCFVTVTYRQKYIGV